MKRIELTQGKFALVDNKDFDWLDQWNWYFNPQGYATRHQYIKVSNGKYKNRIIRMHRLINNTPDGFETDHINRNKLDNRRENLRTVTASINRFNQGLRRDNTSGIKGVSWDKSKNIWKVRIWKNYKEFFLGGFSNLEDAILVRKQAEKIYYNIAT